MVVVRSGGWVGGGGRMKCGYVLESRGRVALLAGRPKSINVSTRGGGREGARAAHAGRACQPPALFRLRCKHCMCLDASSVALPAHHRPSHCIKTIPGSMLRDERACRVRAAIFQ